MIWIGFFMFLSFVAGYYAGKTEVPEKLPKITLPHIKTREERERDKELAKQLDKLYKISQNIENYDGTSASQIKIE